MDLNETAEFIVRITVGVLFVNAAWACGKDDAARQWTITETGLLFKSHTKLFAYGGVLIMGVGGISLIFGLFPRVGGFSLAAFLVPGAMIHFIQRRRAFELEEQIVDSAGSGASASNKDTLKELAVIGIAGPLQFCIEESESDWTDAVFCPGRRPFSDPCRL